MNKLEIFQKVYGTDYVFTENELSRLLRVAELLEQAIAEAEKREWVGLTDHELQVLDFNDPERGKLARAVEAKLKEKNA